jgi:hypothetical protein
MPSSAGPNAMMAPAIMPGRSRAGSRILPRYACNAMIRDALSRMSRPTIGRDTSQFTLRRSVHTVDTRE